MMDALEVFDILKSASPRKHSILLMVANAFLNGVSEGLQIPDSQCVALRCLLAAGRR